MSSLASEAVGPDPSGRHFSSSYRSQLQLDVAGHQVPRSSLRAPTTRDNAAYSNLRVSTDDGGSWQVGVDWKQVLPAWFTVPSATTEPEEYAQQITGLLERHYSRGSTRMLGVARKIAMPARRATRAYAAERRRN
jgi:hypothetical protein